MPAYKHTTVRIHPVIDGESHVEIRRKGGSILCNPDGLFIDYTITGTKPESKKITDVRTSMGTIIIEFEDNTRLFIKGVKG